MCWLTPVIARRSSLKRHGRRMSCHRISIFHFPPRTDNVASISGGGSGREVAWLHVEESVIFSILHHKIIPTCAFDAAADIHHYVHFQMGTYRCLWPRQHPPAVPKPLDFGFLKSSWDLLSLQPAAQRSTVLRRWSLSSMQSDLASGSA